MTATARNNHNVHAYLCCLGYIICLVKSTVSRTIFNLNPFKHLVVFIEKDRTRMMRIIPAAHPFYIIYKV
jgi:hypothetical protein